jgi:intracellular septation protein
MDFSSALAGVLPLLAFAIIDIFAGMRAAIISAIVIAALEAGWSWYSMGEVDSLTWISLGLVLVMGVISYRMKDARLFKFQPVVLAGVLVVVFAWFQWQGSPLLVQMMPKVAKLLSPERQAVMGDERMIKSMARLDFMMIGVFFAHGVLVAWSALRKSTLHWIIMRGVGIYVLIVVAILLNLLIAPTW